MSTKQTSRTARLEARVAPDTLALLQHAAKIQGRTVSDFVVTAAREAAEQAIEDAQVIRLSLDGQQAFADAIMQPRAVPAGFKRAVARHRRLIREAR